MWVLVQQKEEVIHKLISFGFCDVQPHVDYSRVLYFRNKA